MKNPLLLFFLLLSIIGTSRDTYETTKTEFIYGTISTFLGDTYTGQIRWGKEEAFWTDRFNANKVYNRNIDFLSDQEIMQLKREKQMLKKKDWKRMDDGQIQDDKSEYTFLHQFSCQFGEIKNIKMTRWQKAEIELRDGSKVMVSGKGMNDLDTPITIYDTKKGKIEIEWMEISQVHFFEEPDLFKSAIGESLYGTVFTSGGKYTGAIEWDTDERVTTDELDGQHDKGKFKTPFSKIKAIQSHLKGSLVTLKNGKQIYLFGTNDVNCENRGIVVTTKEIGRVNVSWADFEKVEFTQKKKTAKGYQFQKPREITGTVKTKEGKYIKGKIIFDLDEQYDYEVLNGGSGKMFYEIPFRNIRKIMPRGKRNCMVELRSKKTIDLRDSQDVSFKNEGLLVFQESSTSPVYVSWREVEEVVFN
ncbi:MAG TPA: hypothetical protein ENJ53_00965 [Phaeodactylibacter sp.]|nr:hypothetical protein [Phaeodactylibacter sp.]